VKDLNDTKNNLSGAEEEVLKIKTELQSILEIKRVLEEQLEGMVREKEETLTTSKLEGLGIEKVQAELQRVLEANKVLERELEGSITKIEELVELKTSLSESLESTVESAVTIAIAAEVEINTVKLSTLAAEHAEALSFMEDTSRRTIQDKMESAKALFTQLKETIRVLTAKEEELSAQLAMTQVRALSLSLSFFRSFSFSLFLFFSLFLSLFLSICLSISQFPPSFCLFLFLSLSNII
jgi:chromosome segregation ATPase